jgi:exopolyphosphatase / guanosine-5'-triphosphate,3'-diphosphate pyrophosphatase
MTTGAIDIGSNTVRLLILDEQGNDLERRYVVTGLGRGVDQARAFRSDSVAHSLGVLRDYRGAIDRHGVTSFRAVATSATRDVTDGGAFLDAAERILGRRPEVIEGDEEARLSFLGSLRGGHGAPPYLVIDLGGGSTEFVYGVAQPEHSRSVDMGSVRLTERVLTERPATDLLRMARKEADHAFAALEFPGAIGTGVGVGGTFTTLVTLDRRLPYAEIVEGETLTRDQIGALIDRLARVTVAETAAFTGVDPARAPVILGGAIVAERAMAAVGLDEVVASDYDLLDGIALAER